MRHIHSKQQVTRTASNRYSFPNICKFKGVKEGDRLDDTAILYRHTPRVGIVVRFAVFCNRCAIYQLQDERKTTRAGKNRLTCKEIARGTRLITTTITIIIRVCNRISKIIGNVYH
jgi:hypothetical protein